MLIHLSILVFSLLCCLVSDTLFVVVGSGRCSAIDYILLLNWSEFITFIVAFGCHTYLFTSKAVLLTTSYHFLNAAFLLVIVVILSIGKHKCRLLI